MRRECREQSPARCNSSTPPPNEAAFRILLALLDKGNARGKTWFVGAGDKDQVIHATLGADAQYLRERFDHAFPACAAYRCRPLTAMEPIWRCRWARSRTSPRSRGSPSSPTSPA